MKSVFPSAPDTPAPFPPQCLRRGIAACALACLLVVAGCGFPHVGRTRTALQPRVEETMHIKTYPNGLTLLVRQNRSVPLVTADLWVRCGSADEPPQLEGIAHFLEHMVFKGTERLAPGEYDRRIENMGGYLNAATSHDYTHFFITIPSQHFQQAFRELADVVTAASIPEDELERERKVVLEEIRRKQDSPTGSLYEQVFGASFEGTAYAHPVLGSPETVGSMTRDQMLAYHRTHYNPAQIVALVIGDVDIQAVEEAVEQSLVAPFAARTEEAATSATATLDLPRPRPADAKGYTWGVRQEHERDVRETYLMILFAAPGLGDPSQAALSIPGDLAAHILGGTSASRLWQSVREKKRLVSSVSASNISMHGDSALVVFATLEPQNIDAATEAIFADIEEFVRKGPTEEELKRAKKAIANHYQFQTETNSGQASMSGYLYTLTGGLEFEQTYLARIGKTTRRNVRDFAEDYLSRAESNLFLVKPKPPASASSAASLASP